MVLFCYSWWVRWRHWWVRTSRSGCSCRGSPSCVRMHTSTSARFAPLTSATCAQWSGCRTQRSTWWVESLTRGPHGFALSDLTISWTLIQSQHRSIKTITFFPWNWSLQSSGVPLDLEKSLNFVGTLNCQTERNQKSGILVGNFPWARAVFFEAVPPQLHSVWLKPGLLVKILPPLFSPS